MKDEKCFFTDQDVAYAWRLTNFHIKHDVFLAEKVVKSLW